MDHVTKKQRSLNMSRVRGKDTKPELAVRKYLYANGVRYRLHVRLPGKPDVVIRKRRIAVFVNGCFWHAHNCGRFSWPQTNSDFWRSKIENNVARDLKNCAQLDADGWKVLVVWECQIKKDRDVTLGTLLQVCKE